MPRENENLWWNVCLGLLLSSFLILVFPIVLSIQCTFDFMIECDFELKLRFLALSVSYGVFTFALRQLFFGPKGFSNSQGKETLILILILVLCLINLAMIILVASLEFATLPDINKQNNGTIGCCVITVFIAGLIAGLAKWDD